MQASIWAISIILILEAIGKIGKYVASPRHKRNWNKELLVCFAPNISNSGPKCALSCFSISNHNELDLIGLVAELNQMGHQTVPSKLTFFKGFWEYFPVCDFEKFSIIHGGILIASWICVYGDRGSKIFAITFEEEGGRTFGQNPKKAPFLRRTSLSYGPTDW